MFHRIPTKQSTELELMAYQVALLTTVANINAELLRVKESLERKRNKRKRNERGLS